MIKMQIIGHLGKDCTVNEVNGKSVINFSVAHSEKYKNSEGVEVNKTTWVECSFWLEKTTVAQYLKKGTEVYVEGIPSVDTYQNAQMQTLAKQKLRVQDLKLLPTKKE